MIFQRRHEGEADSSPEMVLIGLTGPIGCGKSTVAQMLADVGGAVIDADELARRVTDSGSDALPEIRSRFGDRVFSDDGSLDRTELARVVFSDPDALRELERIVHPRVRPLVEARLIAAHNEGSPFAVIEAIKLVEGGLAGRCDEVWLVECSADTQRARLAGRGASAQDVERRTAAQGADLLDRLASQLAAQAVPTRRVSTEGTIDRTRELVEEALADVLDRPSESGSATV